MGQGSGRASVTSGARGANLSRLLLDTTFLIDADRSGGQATEAIDDDDEVAIAAITVAELRVGVLLATGKSRDERLAFLTDVLETIPIVEYDESVAEAHAELLVHVRRKGTPRGAHDLIIAATARASGREVISADITAFSDLPGVQVRSRQPSTRPRGSSPLDPPHVGSGCAAAGSAPYAIARPRPRPAGSTARSSRLDP